MEEHVIEDVVDETDAHGIENEMSAITDDLHDYEPRTSPSTVDAGLVGEFQDMSLSPNGSTGYGNYRASGSSDFERQNGSSGYTDYPYANQTYMSNYGQHGFMRGGGPEDPNPYSSYSGEQQAYAYPQDTFNQSMGIQNAASPLIHGQQIYYGSPSSGRSSGGANSTSSRPTRGWPQNQHNHLYASPTTTGFQQSGTGGYGSNLYDSGLPEQGPGFGYTGGIDEEQIGVLAEEEQNRRTYSSCYMPAGEPAYVRGHGPVMDGRPPNSSDDPRRNSKKHKHQNNTDFTRHNSRDFKTGHVLMILWSEPKGSEAAAATNTFCSTIKRDVHQKSRRFIIMETYKGHSIGVPIMTYGGQGCKKSGAHPEDHGIVYTGKVAPLPLDGEGMLGYPAIQMIPTIPTDNLLPQSRVNYTKKYTIEHNYKVSFVGHIQSESLKRLRETMAKQKKYGPPPQ